MEDKIELFAGEETMVHASITPQDEKSKGIKYKSSDPSIFTVDKTGKIIGKVHGTAELTVMFENLEETIPVTVKEKKVESIQVSPKNITMKVNEKKKLEVILNPSSALNKTVNYISSDHSVAEVENGQVVAKGVGTATITVKADSGLTDTCIVNVIAEQTTPSFVEVTDLRLNVTSKKINVSESFQIIGTITPGNATNQTLSYTTDDVNIATVDQFGTVIGKNAGTTTIQVTTSNGIRKNVAIEVVANNVPVTAITVNPSSINGKIGDVVTLDPVITPKDATNYSVSFSSSDTSVASVTSSGVVTLKKEGTAMITVQASNGVKTTVSVTVGSEKKTLVIDKKVLKLGLYGQEKITTTVLPEKYSNSEVVYNSSNNKIVTVDASGNVKAVGVGTATITVSLQDDPSIKEIIQVTVNKIDVTSLRIKGDGITYNKTIFIVFGKTLNLKASISPSNATYDKVSWKTGDSSIATVDSKGNLKGIKKGVTTLTVSAGGKTVTRNVSVEANGDKVYFMSTPPSAHKLGSDAMIFESKGKFGMIDTAYYDKENDKCKTLLNLMNDLGVKNLEFITISHFHTDHTGCLAQILENYKVGTVYWKEYYEAKPEDERVARKKNIKNWRAKMKEKGVKEWIANKTTQFDLGNFHFQGFNKGNVFAKYMSQCQSGTVKCNENSQSLTYLVTIGNKRMYFTGDIQNNNELQKYPADTAAGKIGKVDVLKAAHHGNHTADARKKEQTNTVTELSYLKPDYVVINNAIGAWSVTATALNNFKKTAKSIYYTNGTYVSLTITGANKLSFLQGK